MRLNSVQQPPSASVTQHQLQQLQQRISLLPDRSEQSRSFARMFNAASFTSSTAPADHSPTTAGTPPFCGDSFQHSEHQRTPSSASNCATYDTSAAVSSSTQSVSNMASSNNHQPNQLQVWPSMSRRNNHPTQPRFALMPSEGMLASTLDKHCDYTGGSGGASSDRNLFLQGISPSNRSILTPGPPAPSPAMSNSSNSLFSTPSSNSRRHQNSSYSYSHLSCRGSLLRSRGAASFAFPSHPTDDVPSGMMESPVSSTYRSNFVMSPTSNLQQHPATASLSRFSSLQLCPEGELSSSFQKSSSQSKLTGANNHALLHNSFLHPKGGLEDSPAPFRGEDNGALQAAKECSKGKHSLETLMCANSHTFPRHPSAALSTLPVLQSLNTEGLQSVQKQPSRQIVGNGAVKAPLTYTADRIVGNGSFGIVYKAQEVESSETVAIKKVFQDRRYKNRELHIMKHLNCPCVIRLKHAFFTSGDDGNDEVFLNLVMDYVSDTVYREMKHYAQIHQAMPMPIIKVYAYQLCRALAYIHAIGICHRDIKPQNLLVDSETRSLRLCDFGSAKRLLPNYPNVAYICSRYYRAPELIFGATDYTTAIDTWSMGCVIAEMLLGHPMFRGVTGVDQLVDIIKVLGTPTRAQLMAMNRNYSDFKFPYVQRVHWEKVFRNRAPDAAIDLVSQMLQYSPQERIRPIDALAHEFFDDVRSPSVSTGNDAIHCPNAFNFTADELRSCSFQTRQKIVPKWARCLPSALEYLTPLEAEQYPSWFTAPRVPIGNVFNESPGSNSCGWSSNEHAVGRSAEPNLASGGGEADLMYQDPQTTVSLSDSQSPNTPAGNFRGNGLTATGVSTPETTTTGSTRCGISDDATPPYADFPRFNKENCCEQPSQYTTN